MAGEHGRWLNALAAARAGARTANVVWFGDSISELDPVLDPMPWVVGRILSGWTESVQYRNGGAEFTPSMVTTGSPSPDDRAGFGGRSVDLEPGQSSSLSGAGEGVSLLWTRGRGSGVLEVDWGGRRLGAIETAGAPRHSRRTVFQRPEGIAVDTVTVTAVGAPVTLEGAYLHTRNLDHGVRVWPAVRSGNTTQDFIDHPGWGLESLDELLPDLVVIATGTNVATDYPSELRDLIAEVRERSDAEVVVWVPYINTSFTVDEAAEGRAVAEAAGCAVIDAAAALGVPPTVDGAHPSSVGTALAGAHAAAMLSGDPVAAAALIAGHASAAVSGGHIWRPGGGSIAIESPVGASVLAGRGASDDSGHQWALLFASLASGLFGLDGPTFSFGPGGDRPIDTHLTRFGPGQLAINGGSGQVDLGRLLLAAEQEPPAASATGAVLHARSRGGSTELAVRFPDGAVHVLAPARVAGYRAPVPCALAPAHRRAPTGIDLVSGRVYWVPFPALDRPVSATHVWMEVEGPVHEAVAGAAVVASGPDGRPGELVSVSAPDSIDLSKPGMRGAALRRPALVPAGEPWWVAVLSSGTGSPVVAAAEAFDGVPRTTLGSDPVVPEPMAACGTLVLDHQTLVPARPGVGLTHAIGPSPLLHVSLREPGDRHS